MFLINVNTFPEPNKYPCEDDHYFGAKKGGGDHDTRSPLKVNGTVTTAPNP